MEKKLMRTIGQMLILGGLALIGALTMEVVSTDKVADFALLNPNDIAPIRWFSAIATVFVITGVSATVLDKKKK